MSGMQKYKTDCLTKKESLLSSNHQSVAAKHGVRSRTNNPFIFLLLSLILAAPTLNAQIKIEERVEIAPQQILSDDPQFPLELRISVYPSLLAPGDIREIGLSLCERRSFYGCYIIDFPQGQLFDAAITWDPFPGENDYNTPKLVSGTQISDTLLGVEEGFYFKAPEYLTVSYMVAVLEVKTYISGYGLIQDDYLVSMMLDTSLVISFNPANISPSDTSEIVIEKIRSDGVKIPYHPLQQFEVGIIEGCTAGKLLAAGDTASYFNRVTQPIYFVAADSIDEEEDTLKIRVGLNQELIDTYLPLKIKYEKQLAKQEKEERGELKVTEEEKPVEQNPTDNPMISSCSFSTFESFLYEDVTKALQDECEDFKCDTNYEQHFPKVQLDKVPPDYAGFDYCNNLLLGSVGVTDLLFDWEDADPEKKGKLLVPFKVEELCFNNVSNNWNYSIISKNKSEFSNIYDRWDSFYLRVVSTVCLDAYANSGTDFTLIQRLDELDEKVLVENVCLALQDFEYNRPYASDPLFQEELHSYIQTRNNTSEFKFCEIVPADTMHEYVHYKNIEEEIISVLNIRVPELNNEKYLTLFNHIKMECGQTDTPESAEIEIRKQHNKIWERFIEDLKKSDDRRTKDPRNENNTQWSRMVQNLITEYQDELKRIYPGGGHCSIIEITRRDI